MTPFPSAVATAGWSPNPLQLAAPLLVAIAYGIRVRNLARRGRPVPWARRAAFYLGVAVVVAAVASPIDSVGEERLFWVHMVQHLMLGDIGALLIVCGLTGPILRPLLAARPVRALRILAHPLVAIPVWAVNLYVWHLPVLYEAALRHDAVHALEHFLFLTTGALMWAAIIEPLPGPLWFGSGPKAACVLVIRTLQAALANVFIWSGTAFYDFYAPGEHASGIAPETDQAIAGAIMFVEGAVVTLVVFAWLFLRWFGEAEVRQRLEDEGTDAERSARAARYRRSELARSAERPHTGP
jgi:cytochrome c oxidase assembly factor CtaG